MKHIFILCFFLLSLVNRVHAQRQIITTIAGNGTEGYSGDGGAAIDAALYPCGIAADKYGNIYVADFENARIRKISVAGIITTVGGNGFSGYTGDGGAATAAKISGPSAIALDSAGDIFFNQFFVYSGDTGYCSIRKINTSGIISTVAGNGVYGHAGDGGPATNAEFGEIYGLAADRFGNVYASDYYISKIRKISTSGIISTFAGTGTAGFSGDGGSATTAQLSAPQGLAVDTLGNLYVADTYNQRIRKVSTDGTITTYAGGGSGSGDGIAATSAALYPSYVATDDTGNIYFNEFAPSYVFKVNTSGVINTIAGNGTFGETGDGGPATDAEIILDYGIAADHSGNVYISEVNYYHIRKIGSNHPPHFVRGHIQGLEVCEYSGAVSINSLLSVIDTDLDQKEIWSIVTAPSHGTASVVDTMVSTGDTLYVTGGKYYTPASGYSGMDTFKVQVTDGIVFDTTTIIVTVNPIGVITGNICIGSAGVSITLSDTTSGGSWISSNTTIAIVGSGTGIVTGEGSGTAIISYTVPTGCMATTVVIVHPVLPPITGAANICWATSATLSDVEGSGVWSSTNAVIAAVGSATGVVTGVNAGTAIITYDVGAGCITTASVTIYSLPISGVTHVCAGATTALSDTAASGAWTSGSTSIATVGAATGAVTGVVAGTAMVTCTLTSGCRGTTAITVNPIAAITGVDQVCPGFTSPLSDVATGGTWSSSDYAAASVGSATGIVTGMLGGTTIITYVISATGCAAYTLFTVNPEPAPISGVTTICLGYTSTLSDIDPGGTWSASDIFYAVVGSGSGIVTGLSTGPDTIIYTLPTGCSNYTVVDVLPNPAPITGTTAICTGTGTVLSDATSGGSWTSSNTAVAPVISGTGLASGASAGSTIITFTISASGCYTTTTLTVFSSVSAISGITSVCAGTATLLGDAATGGIWSSGDIVVAAIGSSSGTLTGLSGGTASITYSLGGTCRATRVETVLAAPSAITGLAGLCPGSVINLHEATFGGTWTSGHTSVASVVTSTGAVTGVSAGTATITYTGVNGCMATLTVTVSPPPSAITGTLSVCPGSTTDLADATTGGTWTSGRISVATTGSGTGVVTGITAGTAIITYAISTGCTATATLTVVNPPGAISGISSLCAGGSGLFTDGTGGGAWNSSNTGIATVGSGTGTVTGVSAGTAIITYSIGAGCMVTKTMTVLLSPSAISGATTVCAGATTGLFDAVSGGTWTSGLTAIAAIGSGTGIVSGIATGTSVITYTLTTGCKVTDTVTVSGAPEVIAGPGTVCALATILLTDAVSGGAWSSSSTGTAGIGTGTGLVSGISAGTADITYSLGTGCVVTKIITVYSALPGIGGASAFCAGSAITLTDGVTGGSWGSLSSSIATAGSSGIVSGISAGTVIITYSLGTGCGAATTVTVEPSPSAITGATAVCIGASINEYDATGGGTWSSLWPVIASVGSTGVVTGMNLGTDIVSYTLSSGCAATTTITLVFAPSVLEGDSTVCVGSEIYLGDEVIGGRWSSSAAGIASVGTNIGLVTGVSAGTAMISYSLGTGCFVTKPVTVFPLPDMITGTMHVCVGNETALSDATTGGTWSSPGYGGVATVVSTGSLSGMVTGVSAGTAMITYTSSERCLTMAMVTVNATPAAIAGSLTVCAGSAGLLTDGTGGGTWNSAGAVAIISSGTGAVSGVAAGTEVVTYTLGTGCLATAVLTVSPLPAAILGVTALCQGSTITLYDSSSGGLWSSSTSSLSAGSLSGVVTGVSAGTGVVTYTQGGCFVHTGITVNPVPDAITGAANGCAGLTSLLTDLTSGGTWSCSDTAIATLGAATGVLTGLTGGAVTISYTLSTGCMAGTGLTVNPTPTRITGAGTLCSGSSLTLTDSTGGGVWSSGETGIATAGSLSGVVTGVSAGTTLVSYVIGGCGATKVLLINPLPDIITGADSMCEAGATVHVYDATSSGFWTSTFVTIDTAGLVTSFSEGVGIVSYTIGAGCFVTKTISVLPLPDEITGADYVCPGSAISLSDGTSGGVWSSPGYGAFATVGSVSGVVTGIATGTAIISYTISTGCFTPRVISVNPLPQPIAGGTSVCVDASVTFADTTTGGSWSSGTSGVASVGSGSGVVTGVSAGTALISYSVTNLCGTAVVTKPVTVNPLPDAGVISGPGSVCKGAQVNLTDGIAGGVWGSSNGSATVGSTGSLSGLVSGVIPGVDTISYTVTNLCGVATTIQTMTVNPLPFAGEITGADSVCPGDTVTVTDAVAGGAWGSSNANITEVSNAGQVAGLVPGVDTINYSVTNSCGIATAIYSFKVMSLAECTNEVRNAGLKNSTFTVYPNPNNGTFSVLLSSGVDEQATVTITSVLGTQVKVLTIKSNVASDMQLNEAAGVYIISVAAGDGVFVERVTVAF